MNRLSTESSPYLRQHAHNPVDWYPWGTEALQRAEAEDRPILLSIGYSACHWCHVMERESFEDPVVAGLMNRLFVNIKVDREARPDLDQIYMKAVQAMTGRGGWPMTVFLTPDRIPYYGGTYYPPTPRHGMPSFSQVLQAAGDAYRDRGDAVRETGAQLLESLRKVSAGTTPTGPADPSALDTAYRVLASQYDRTHGGFGNEPKFPQPVTLEFLLRYHLRAEAPAALEMVVHTLRRMAAGGLRDHLAGGFHRYSVDRRWLVPHFEKMLYDNALLARVYLDAYRVTGADDLRGVAEQTLDYLASDMRAPEGGFYSARDADSEGEEGTFYVWTSEEIDEVLDPEEARLFRRIYDVTPSGNFEGRNILHLPHDLEAVGTSEGVVIDTLEEVMAAARSKLLTVRARREAPFRDEKVLVAWNAMAIRAFAEAGAALGRQDYLDVAEHVGAFVLSELRPAGRLLHLYMEGEATIDGFLDDHGALGNAMLSLHAATLGARWLDAARWLCEEILDRFWDSDSRTVYDTAADAEQLILRPRDPMDNATPSGPSLAAELLARAGHVFDEPRYREVAGDIIAREADHLGRFGPAFGRMLSVLDRVTCPPVEVAILGRSGDAATRALVRASHADFISNLTIVGHVEGEERADIPLFEGRNTVDGRAIAFVCRGYVCSLPAADPDAVAADLKASRRG